MSNQTLFRKPNVSPRAPPAGGTVPSPRAQELKDKEVEAPRSPRTQEQGGKDEEKRSPRDGQPALEKKKSLAASTLSSLQSRTKTIVNKAASKMGKARKSGVGPVEEEDLVASSSGVVVMVEPAEKLEDFPAPGRVPSSGTEPSTPKTVKSPRQDAVSLSRDSSGSVVPVVGSVRRANSQDYTNSPQISTNPSSGNKLPAVRSAGVGSGGVLKEAGESSSDFVPSVDGRGYDLHKTLKLPKGFVNQFRLADSDDNLVFSAPPYGDDGPKIRGGTLQKLVERLTFPESADPEYAKMFLLTYRSFTTPRELMTLLQNRFFCPLESEEADCDTEARRALQKPVRLRVYAVLKLWVSQGDDFRSENDGLVHMLKEFSRTYIEPVMPSGARQLMNLLEKALSNEELTKNRVPISSKDMPKAFLPACRPSELSLLTIHPQEIARQLTLMESELFQAVKPWELLNLAWSRKGKEEKAPNVLAMIGRANLISPWLGHQIVSNKSMKVRADLVTRCIQCMLYLEDLHNFNGLMEFMAALQNAGVHRLRETFAHIDKKWKRHYDMICERMSPDKNFANFRESLRNVSPPSIPFLGLYLQDLTFIEEGNPDYLDEDRGIINIQKRVQCSQIITEIQMSQQTPYLLQPVLMVQDFLRDIEQFSAEAIYDASLAIKARAADSKEVDEGSVADVVKPKQKTDADDWGELNFPPGYPFAEPDSDDNIVLGEENNKVVLYATTAKLVERLTYEKHSDQTFVSAFLLTYHFMMSSQELLELLFLRYDVPFPVKDDADTRTKYDARVVRPIRLRVFNALKQWVDKYPQDFSDSEVARMLQTFAEDTMKSTGMQKSAERLIEGLQVARTMCGLKLPTGTPNTPKRGAGGKAPPAVIYPRIANLMDATVWDLSPVELARQITLMEFALYRAIGDREILMWHPCESHPKVDRETNSPNAMIYFAHNSWLVSWTLGLVLLQPDAVTSAAVSKCLEHLIALADALRGLNNFNACRCIVEGLSHSALVPLDAWVSLSTKSAKTFESLKDFHREIKTYVSHQQWLQKVPVPALPSLQTCLDELDRVERALPDKISEMIHPEKLWHVDKKLKQHKIVTDFLVFQGSEFLLDESKELVALINLVPLAPTAADELTSLCDHLNESMEEADAAHEAAIREGAASDTSLKARMKEAVGQLKKSGKHPSSQTQLRLVGTTTTTPGTGGATNSPAVTRAAHHRGERSASVAQEEGALHSASPSDESPRKIGGDANESPRKHLTASPRRISAALLPASGSVASIGYDLKRDSERRDSKDVSTRGHSPVPPSDSRSAVSKEWVREAIRAAVQEAVQPLQEEIAMLKAQLASVQKKLLEAPPDESEDDPFA